MSKISFCIFLPAYNEQNGIEQCVRNIHCFLSENNIKASILVVDDGSTDNTLNVLNQLKDQVPNLIIHSYENNQGYGEANRIASTIIQSMGFDYALIMDADGTQAPIYIKNFLPLMENGIDFIKATRYSKGGRVKGVPFKRVLISKFGNRLAGFFIRINLTDFTNGFRAIKSNIWADLKSTERGFEVLIEEVYLASKLNIKFDEVPYVLEARDEVYSKSKFSYKFKVYFRYLQYLFK